MIREFQKTCLMLILVVLGFGMTSCVNSEDNPVQPVTPTDPVAQWLSAIPGVSNVKIFVKGDKTQNPVKIYDFKFDQPIDHKNPAKGSFKQRVTMVYRDPSAINVLLTEGYALSESPDSITDSGISHMMVTNEICVEYRYFGSSLPETFDNLDFTYLRSEQASADLHAVVTALKQTGRFPQKWIATGVSKSGIASALYAYYDEKNGWNDIDVYVPFCAPFCESLEDTRLGQYLEKNSLAHRPEAQARYEAFVKSLFTNSNLGNYLLQKAKQTMPEGVASLKKQGMTDDDLYWYFVNYYAVRNQHFQFVRTSYVPIDLWASLIPSATASTDLELEWAYQFLLLDHTRLWQFVGDTKSAGTRATMTDEQRQALLLARSNDSTMPYNVQAVIELGTFALTYDFLNGTPGVIPSYQKDFEEQGSLKSSYPMYVDQYDNTMMMDFLKNFLPKTSKKMIFVYGGQDPWTGGAIPEPTNPNVKKIINPGGVHNDFIFIPTDYATEYSELIMAWIYAFLLL